MSSSDVFALHKSPLLGQRGIDEFVSQRAIRRCLLYGLEKEFGLRFRPIHPRQPYAVLP